MLDHVRWQSDPIRESKCKQYALPHFNRSVLFSFRTDQRNPLSLDLESIGGIVFESLFLVILDRQRKACGYASFQTRSSRPLKRVNIIGSALFETEYFAFERMFHLIGFARTSTMCKDRLV